MSRLRVPVVMGLGERVGTSTLCSALHANENDDWEHAADVVVCAGGDALRRAGALGGAPYGPLPVLAVVTAAGEPEPPPDRLRALASRFATVVPFPHVGRWHGLEWPPVEATLLLGLSPDELAPALRPYAAALRLVAGAVLRSGQLQHPAPPSVIRPLAAETWLPLRPVERPAPVRPVVLSTLSTLRSRQQPVVLPGRRPAEGFGGGPAGGRAGRGPARVPDHEPDDEALEAAGFAGVVAPAGTAG